MATTTETVTATQTPPSSPKPTPHSPKPTPTRRGTLNFGLRRKSSAASLTPSANGSVNGRGSIDAEAPATNGNGDESMASTEAKRGPTLKPKRMFSLLASRSSKSSMPSVDASINGTHSLEASEMSEAGSENGVPATQTEAKPSSGSLAGSFFSSQRRGSGGKVVEALSQEKKQLEEQVESLKLEKSALEAAFETEKKENERLTTEAAKRKEEWDGEKEKLREEVGAQVVEKDEEIKALTATVVELREELERTKESQRELIAFKESAASDLEAKLTEQEHRVRETVKEEKVALEAKLTEAQTSIDAKDQTIKGLEGQVSELQVKAQAADEELKKLKEEKEKREKDLQADATKRVGSCSIM